MTAFTNLGPPTSPPGKIFRISQPSSSACESSEALPQPGEYGILRRLQARGLPVLALVVSDAPEEVGARAPWLAVLQPGKIQQGLAAVGA